MNVFAKQALLPNGWAKNVGLSWVNGQFTRIEENLTPAPDAVVVDNVLPGLTNLHSHAFQRAMAGLTEFRTRQEDSFWTWRELMYRFASTINPEQLEAIATWLYIEMLKAGYTGVCEFHYLHHDVSGKPYTDPAEMSLRILHASNTSGISLTHLPVLYQYSGFGAQAPLEGQKRFLHNDEAYHHLLQRINAQLSSHQVLGIAPHSLRAVDENGLNAAIAALNQTSMNGPVHIHIAEQLAEVEACQQWSGARPVEWLLKTVDVNARWCLVHATHMNADERHALAKSGAVAGICTTTEANLGDGFFDIAEYLAEQGVFGVGSDSNCSVSPVEELRWLEYGARLVHKKRAVLCSDQLSVGQTLYQNALAGGARAAGRRTGRIEIGCSVDLISLDASHPTLIARNDREMLDSWIFSGQENRVQEVWVAGEHCVRNAAHKNEIHAKRAFERAIKELRAGV